MQTATRQPANARRPIQPFDRGWSFVVQHAQGQKGNKDEKQTLASQAVQKAKVFAEHNVKFGNGHPETEFVGEQQSGEDCHVYGQKYRRPVLHARGIVVNDCHDT